MKASKKVLEEDVDLTIVLEIEGKHYVPVIRWESVDAVRASISQVVEYLVEVEVDIRLKEEQK